MGVYQSYGNYYFLSVIDVSDMRTDQISLCFNMVIWAIEKHEEG